MIAPKRPGRGLIAAVGLMTAAVLAVALAIPGAPGQPQHEAAARPKAATRTTLRATLAALTERSAIRPCHPMESLRPQGPPVVTPGSYMAKIRARGWLIAGVDQNTYPFGYLNPRNEQIEGFDIDMLHAISAAIFGNPNKIHYVAMTDAQRIPAIRHGQVDIVAHTMTINCWRLSKVDFSTVYFEAVQRTLVLTSWPFNNIASFDTLHICATTGSTSLKVIDNIWGLGVAVAVPSWTDCLVQLQQGDVTAISTDNGILGGLAAQDPYTKIIGPALSNQPYGLAISKQHADFVRFVNAVLAKMRADGRWAAIYRRWIGKPVPAPPQARYLP